MFYLEYLKEGTSGWRTLRLDPRIEDVARSINVKVSDLNPSTLYTVRLRSRNAHGWSNYSHAAQVVTDGELGLVREVGWWVGLFREGG